VRTANPIRPAAKAQMPGCIRLSTIALYLPGTFLRAFRHPNNNNKEQSKQ
jgi:hypothetical protein